MQNARGLATALLVAASVLAGCGAPPPTASSAVPASTLSIDCGPWAGRAPDCISIVAAAARVAPITIAEGTGATVTDRPITRACDAPPSCISLAAAGIYVHVTFTAPGGAQASAGVVTNPLGEYTGVDPASGP